MVWGWIGQDAGYEGRDGFGAYRGLPGASTAVLIAAVGGVRRRGPGVRGCAAAGVTVHDRCGPGGCDRAGAGGGSASGGTDRVGGYGRRSRGQIDHFGQPLGAGVFERCPEGEGWLRAGDVDAAAQD